MEDTAKWRDRKFRLELYPEDPTHAEAFQRMDKAGYTYAAILHDKDVWREDDPKRGERETGSLKKPHWHVVLKFSNPRFARALSKELGIAINYFAECANVDGALLYLVHANNPDKYQYDVDEVFGSLASRVYALLSENEDEGARVLEIVKMVDAVPGKARYRDILVKCCKGGFYGEFRRLGAGVKYLIDEHNEEVQADLSREWERDCEHNHLNLVHGKAAGMDWVERCERLERQGVSPNEI